MGKNYLISIIIYISNELFLEEVLNSIKNQTIGFNNLEIILVGNNHAPLLNDYSNSYSNINLIQLNKCNSGGCCKNDGIFNASADYLIFLDSYNVLFENACEVLLEKIEEEGIDFVSGTYFASKNDNYLQNEYYFLNFNLSNSFSNNGNTDDILTCDLISAPNIYKKSLILEKKIEFFTDEPIGNLIFSFNYFLKSTGDLLFIDTPIFEYLYFNNYDYYRKYDLLDYVDFNRDLFYLILNFDNNLSSIYINQFLNWVYQFISSDLNRSDRIELLRYSEFIFLELNKFKIFDNEYIEWIVKLVINKQFFEASVVVDLIHLKNKSIMNNDVDSKIRMFEKLFNTNYKFEEIFYVDSNIIDFNNKLADIKLNHDFLSRFRLNSEIMKAINLIKKWNLFDEKFYNLKYGYEGNLNPLLHYIFIGFKEGKNPSLIFDGYYYSENFKDFDFNMNPLVHFVLYGLDEGFIKINERIYQHKSINKSLLRKKLKNFKDLGVTDNKRKQKIIISLTSFPERMYDIKFTLYSLLTQTVKPDEVILWLAKDQFPNREDDIPQDVLSLKKNGLTIKWCDDLRSYKKLIPSLISFPNDYIVTADDDLYYHENWLKQLVDDYKLYPNTIICQRSRRISFNDDGNLGDYSSWKLSMSEEAPSFLNFSTNGAGSLFPPNSLDGRVINLNLFNELCPYGDDIWIWAMAILNKTKIKTVSNNMALLTYVNPAREAKILNESTLFAINSQGKNDNQIDNIINYFPEILKIIKNSS